LKSFLKQFARATGCVAELPKSYPEDPKQFRLENPEWYERAYQSLEVPVPSRYTVNDLEVASALTPCRSSHHMTKEHLGHSLAIQNMKGPMSSSVGAFYQAAAQAAALAQSGIVRMPTVELLPGLQMFGQGGSGSPASASTASAGFGSPLQDAPRLAITDGTLAALPTSAILPAAEGSKPMPTTAEAIVALMQSKFLADSTSGHPKATLKKPAAAKATATKPAAAKATLKKKPPAAKATLKKPAAAKATLKKPAAMPAVRPNELVLGCSKCRYIWRGCGQCRKPLFNGRRGRN
jgi:hypothetical protein